MRHTRTGQTVSARFATSGALALAALAALALVPGTSLAQTQTAPKPAAGGAAVSLEDLMPAGSLGLLGVPDIQAARQAAAATRGAAMYGEFAPFARSLWDGFAPQIEQAKGELAKNAGFTFDAALTALGGGFQVGVMGIDQAQGGRPLVVAALRTTGREQAVKDVLAGLARQGGGRQGPPPQTHGGVSITNLPGSPLFYCEVSGLLVLGISPDDLKGVIDRSQGKGQGPSLRDDPAFKASRERTAAGRTVLFGAYVNLAPLAAMAMEQAKDQGPRQGKALETLGLPNLKGLDIAVTADGDMLCSRMYLSAPVQGERRGMLGLFQHGAVDPKVLGLAPANALGVVAGRFDLGALYDRAVALVTEIEPEGRKEFDKGLAEIEKHLGMSIRKDLLGALGKDWLLVSFMPKQGGLPATVYSVELVKPDGYVQMVTKLAQTLGAELVTRELAGRTYYYMLVKTGRLGQNPFEPGRGVDPQQQAMNQMVAALGQTWTIDAGRLYIADMPHSLADYFEIQKDGGSLTSSEAWKSVAAKMPQGAQALTFNRPEAYGGGGYNLIIRIVKLLEGLGRSAGIPLDVNRMPRYEALAQHLRPGFAGITFDQNGVFCEARSVTGELDSTGAVVAATAVVAAIAIPNLIEARKGANEASAIGSLRTLVTCQALYRDGDKDKDGQSNYATSLAQIQQAGLCDAVLGSGMKQGYFFVLKSEDPMMGYSVEAHPMEPGKTGDRYFFVDETGVIRFESWRPAGPDSFPIGG